MQDQHCDALVLTEAMRQPRAPAKSSGATHRTQQKAKPDTDRRAKDCKPLIIDYNNIRALLTEAFSLEGDPELAPIVDQLLKNNQTSLAVARRAEKIAKSSDDVALAAAAKSQLAVDEYAKKLSDLAASNEKLNEYNLQTHRRCQEYLNTIHHQNRVLAEFESARSKTEAELAQQSTVLDQLATQLEQQKETLQTYIMRLATEGALRREAEEELSKLRASVRAAAATDASSVFLEEIAYVLNSAAEKLASAFAIYPPLPEDTPREAMPFLFKKDWPAGLAHLSQSVRSIWETSTKGYPFHVRNPLRASPTDLHPASKKRSHDQDEDMSSRSATFGSVDLLSVDLQAPASAAGNTTQASTFICTADEAEFLRFYGIPVAATNKVIVGDIVARLKTGSFTQAILSHANRSRRGLYFTARVVEYGEAHTCKINLAKFGSPSDPTKIKDAIVVDYFKAHPTLKVPAGFTLEPLHQ
jgi:hypothetical protein